MDIMMYGHKDAMDIKMYECHGYTDGHRYKTDGVMDMKMYGYAWCHGYIRYAIAIRMNTIT